MPKILIDTSLIIDFLRQKDKNKTLLFYFANKEYQLCVSIITHAESYAGKSVWEKVEAKRSLEKLFSTIQIMPITSDLSKKAGEISARYNVDIVDAIIAATALLSDMGLATLNTKDFENIDGVNLFPRRQDQ